MINEQAPVQQTDTVSSLLALSHLTDRLRKQLSSVETTTIGSLEQAIQLLNTLPGLQDHVIDANTIESVLDEARIRLLVTALCEDEEVHPLLTPLLANPPHYAQRSYEELKTVAVVLGCLVTWLQTKIHIHVMREDGKTEFKFELLKPKTSDNVVNKVIDIIKKVVAKKD